MKGRYKKVRVIQTYVIQVRSDVTENWRTMCVLGSLKKASLLLQELQLDTYAAEVHKAEYRVKVGSTLSL